ncbi:antitoxin [Pseudonocardia sp. T1-2H]|uniref:antitoxin n=1 Tax=Pseudonocardia sp. T1-2H TaxID=3128899 RepID=UPI00310192ED
MMRKLTALAGAAEAARRYAKKNPDKAGKILDQAAQFVDKQTKGKYSGQISSATRKVKDVAGVPQPGAGYGAPGTTTTAYDAPHTGSIPGSGNSAAGQPAKDTPPTSPYRPN